MSLGERAKGWRRSGFEVFVVFLGVLIALFVDEWNTDRQQRSLEQQYLNRIIQDVVTDTTELRELMTTLDAKAEALAWVAQLEPRDVPSAASESAEVVTQLGTSMSAGFGVLKGATTTFEDLSGSGNLSLVRDPELRASLVDYYEAWEFNAARVEARRTEYPALLYALLPAGAFDSDVYFDSPAPNPNVALDAELIAQSLLSDAGRLKLGGELNYSRFFRGVAEDLHVRAIGLLLQLDVARR